ncbi:hypothetical protein pipiens_018002 [Culex pipiens pipiens]|uniref:C2H2-type domain-containing protein n=1 Tax=Culex pipiens pipiens TaxID=38569 RepID=A0ABD1CF22_CULPP
MPDLVMPCLVHAPESLLQVPIIPYCRRFKMIVRSPILEGQALDPEVERCDDCVATGSKQVEGAPNGCAEEVESTSCRAEIAGEPRRLVHARFEPHKSNLCKRSFLNETTIKEHVQQFHSLELTETSCVVCGKLCKNHNAMLKHAGNTRGNGPAMESTAAPSVANRLKRHMVSHRNKTVRCEICSEDSRVGDLRDADSAGRQSPTEEHCKSCEHNAKLTYNDLNWDKFPAGTDRRLSTSTSLPAARRLIGMFTVWMKA